jgi:Protein of unknown function (DUF3311)
MNFTGTFAAQPSFRHNNFATARVPSMRSIRWLAVAPFLALLVGPFFVNQATPLILGLPFLLAWIVAWILITSLIMLVIYAVDQANREEGA